MKNKVSRRLAAIAGIAGVTTIALGSFGAGGAAAGALPGGTVTQTLVDGTNVTITLKDEFVDIQPSTVALPTSRNVWLSGKILVDVAGDAEGGNIEAGYIVGCQLNFGAEAGGNLDVDVDINQDSITTIGDGTAGNDVTGLGEDSEAAGGFTLSPGEAKYFAFFTDDGDNTGFDFEGSKGGLAYSQETFAVDGCAGFAEAKAYVKVTVETPSVTGIVTLYGAPFSIG